MSEEKPEYKADEGKRLTDPVIASESEAICRHELAAATARITALEASVAEKDAALTEAKKAMETQASDFAALKTTHEAAVTAYKKLAVSSNPFFPRS